MFGWKQASSRRTVWRREVALTSGAIVTAVSMDRSGPVLRADTKRIVDRLAVLVPTRQSGFLFPSTARSIIGATDEQTVTSRLGELGVSPPGLSIGRSGPYDPTGNPGQPR